MVAPSFFFGSFRGDSGTADLFRTFELAVPLDASLFLASGLFVRRVWFSFRDEG